ncbi:MAG TPA: MCE family protein [Aeromicrobium sp.]|nr:MCE family protein [Aeromicrobium sp.]
MTRAKHLILVLAVSCVLSGCSFSIHQLPWPGDKVSDEDSYEVKADFNDALNVVPRTSVMVADVPVGQVEEIVREGWHARVTMRINKKVVLPDDAVAELRQTSLLGEKFIALSAPKDGSGQPSGARRLSEGDVIPLSHTGRNPEVEEVLGALSFLLTGGGLGQLQTVTQELNAMMDGRTDNIRNVLEELNTLTGTLNSQSGDIVRAMDALNGLSTTLVDEKDAIGDALDAAGPAIEVLQDQHEELVEALDELDKLGSVGTDVINSVKDDLITELRHLEPILRNLANTGKPLVPGLLKALSYPFPIDAANTIHGDYANVVFKMQFKLTPVSEGGLLPTTPEELITLCRGLPTAPLCSGGSPLADFCTVLAALPLCTSSVATTSTSSKKTAAANGSKSSGVTPVVPKPSASAPVPGTGGEGPLDGVVGTIRDLLGGGGQ